MRVCVISDIHGKYERLYSLKESAEKADALIVNGDLTHFGDEAEAHKVIAELKKLHPRVYAVPGNCDGESVASVMESEGISIDGGVHTLQPEKGREDSGEATLYGIGGALPGPVPTPNEYSKEELEVRLSEISRVEGKPLILVSHQPPQNTIADRVFKIKHVGSRVLRKWMESFEPLLVLTGHIHESRGFRARGKTWVLNPGAFKDGRWAEVEIDITGRKVSAQLRSF
ncbi:MAG: metallophosphoesterase [Spirochaetia bacterium]